MENLEDEKTFMKFMKNSQGTCPQVGMLRKPNGQLTESPEETLQVMFGKFFPGAEILQDPRTFKPQPAIKIGLTNPQGPTQETTGLLKAPGIDSKPKQLVITIDKRSKTKTKKPKTKFKKPCPRKRKTETTISKITNFFHKKKTTRVKRVI